jgi:hypothetical protein
MDEFVEQGQDFRGEVTRLADGLLFDPAGPP